MKDWRKITDKYGKELFIPPKETLEFVVHKDAPLFSGSKHDHEIIEEIVQKSSEKGNSDKLLELFRQAGLCSLWFFEKHILGAYGPYSRLTDHLHVNMCNFRQRLLNPGARGAMLVPRSCYKTTIGTHGADTWEIIRNPNIRIGVIGATLPDARRFSAVIQANFEQNDFLRRLWPEAAPERNYEGVIVQKDWTQNSFIIPSRTRYFPEPTVKCLGAGGATAGNHFDLLNVDDLVGEQQLNADHVVTADMLKAKNWFKNNADTLLDAPEESRIFLSATRYAVDDAYDWIAEDAGPGSEGYFAELPEECQIKDDGRWQVYYRQALEYDKPIFPEKVTKEFLERLQRTNPWGYFTQYLNNPYAASVSELSAYKPSQFNLNYDHRVGYEIVLKGPHYDHEIIPLDECLVTMGIDPAASDRKRSDRTSRSAIVVKAKDHKERNFLLDVQAGYWSPSEFIEKLFNTFQKFYPHVKRTNLEKMGAFAIFFQNVQREQQERGIYLGLYPVTTGGDKDTKIRNFYQPLLERNLLYVNESCYDLFYDEMRVFPGGTKKDILDAGVISDDGVGLPRDPNATKSRDSFESRRKRYTNKITGV